MVDNNIVIREPDSEQEIDVLALLEIVNAAYKVGEAGIMVDTDEHPFERMQESDLKQLIQDKQLLVAHLQPSGELIGCIKVVKISDEVGELGLLTLKSCYQGKGYGSAIFKAAENHIKEVYRCPIAQLELLTPSSWTHEHKERLRQWYVRVGYKLSKDTYEESTQRIKGGTMLLDRFLLATDSDFTYYQRQL